MTINTGNKTIFMKKRFWHSFLIIFGFTSLILAVIWVDSKPQEMQNEIAKIIGIIILGILGLGFLYLWIRWVITGKL